MLASPSSTKSPGLNSRDKLFITSPQHYNSSVHAQSSYSKTKKKGKKRIAAIIPIDGPKASPVDEDKQTLAGSRGAHKPKRQGTDGEFIPNSASSHVRHPDATDGTGKDREETPENGGVVVTDFKASIQTLREEGGDKWMTILSELSAADKDDEDPSVLYPSPITFHGSTSPTPGKRIVPPTSPGTAAARIDGNEAEPISSRDDDDDSDLLVSSSIRRARVSSFDHVEHDSPFNSSNVAALLDAPSLPFDITLPNRSSAGTEDLLKRIDPELHETVNELLASYECMAVLYPPAPAPSSGGASEKVNDVANSSESFEEAEKCVISVNRKSFKQLSARIGRLVLAIPMQCVTKAVVSDANLTLSLFFERPGTEGIQCRMYRIEDQFVLFELAEILQSVIRHVDGKVSNPSDSTAEEAQLSFFELPPELVGEDEEGEDVMQNEAAGRNIVTETVFDSRSQKHNTTGDQSQSGLETPRGVENHSLGTEKSVTNDMLTASVASGATFTPSVGSTYTSDTTSPRGTVGSFGEASEGKSGSGELLVEREAPPDINTNAARRSSLTLAIQQQQSRMGQSSSQNQDAVSQSMMLPAKHEAVREASQKRRQSQDEANSSGVVFISDYFPDKDNPELANERAVEETRRKLDEATLGVDEDGASSSLLGSAGTTPDSHTPHGSQKRRSSIPSSYLIQSQSVPSNHVERQRTQADLSKFWRFLCTGDVPPDYRTHCYTRVLVEEGKVDDLDNETSSGVVHRVGESLPEEPLFVLLATTHLYILRLGMSTSVGIFMLLFLVISCCRCVCLFRCLFSIRSSLYIINIEHI